jgi:hypothetical protein
MLLFLNIQVHKFNGGDVIGTNAAQLDSTSLSNNNYNTPAMEVDELSFEEFCQHELSMMQSSSQPINFIDEIQIAVQTYMQIVKQYITRHGEKRDAIRFWQECSNVSKSSVM